MWCLELIIFVMYLDLISHNQKEFCDKVYFAHVIMDTLDLKCSSSITIVEIGMVIQMCFYLFMTWVALAQFYNLYYKKRTAHSEALLGD